MTSTYSGKSLTIRIDGASHSDCIKVSIDGIPVGSTHVDAKNEKTYCIHSNALPIYEDLKLFLDRPGDYFLFIDDANQLSGLQHIIRYVSMKPEGYNVKILITVRDYALQKVINDVQAITSYEIVNVNVFSENEIKELLETSLGILNSDYQERIIRIAEGNARIAILAQSFAAGQLGLGGLVQIGAELGKSRQFAVLRQVQAQGSGHF